MAEFLWTFAVQEVLKRVLKHAAGEIVLARGLKKEVSKLRKSLLMAQAILRDVDQKKLRHDSVRLWVEELQHVVYEADNLLDELAYEDLRRKVETGKMKVRDSTSPSNNLFVFHHKMAKQMKGITKILYKQFSEASLLGLVGVESTETETGLSQIRETISDLDEIEVVGREIEVSNIVKQVIDASNQQVMSIIPIVGMGGLGKTTLAKLVFNHEVIKRHFDETIWVCVSEPFLINKILKAILQTLKGTSCGLDSKEALLRELQKEMQGKTYLLVLDDVWNENPLLWNELKYCLLKINGKSENSIIVTTRSIQVAKIMETLPSHHLRKLSDDQCWSLFKASANANGLQMTPKLESIQENLIKKFGGIPLVARVLGGAVKFQGNYETWVTTLESIVKIPFQGGDFVLSTLKLSVDRLPFSLLKQCFAYCSNFPKGFKFQKEQLIQMWIAQGFIELQEEGCNIMMEDIGEKYFNILLSCSLFQDVVKDERGRIIYCKLHDLLHDIACDISNPRTLQLDPVNLFDKELNIDCGEKDARKLRSLICDQQMFHNKIMDCISLRILIVDLSSIDNLPDAIGKLKHLRYLDISHSSIRKLPESIVLLYNLQTLRTGGSSEYLPNNLRKLISLRHLEFSVHSIDKIRQMPPHLSTLIQLQTLSSFAVGFEKGCKIEELGPLKNLKGRLILSHLERVEGKEEAMAAKLVEKENLCELFLEWTLCSRRNSNKCNDLEVLGGLQPHGNLQFLSITNFAGELLPNSIFVENLVVIRLQNCERCVTLPMLGQLPSLEELEIFGLHSVRSIGNEFYGNESNQKAFFPKLKKFQLYMSNLEHWGEVAVVSNGMILPCLESLEIYSPKLMSIPNLFGSPHDDGVGNLRYLCILGCFKLTKLPTGLEFCSSMENLKISSCPNLILNFHMPKLCILEMGGFQKLPKGLADLTNLKELQIGGCMQDYDFSPLINLPSLVELWLTDNLRSAAQLPQQLEHLTALRSLSIWGFDGIEALPEWLGNLKALETLYLTYCRNLKHLPSREAMLQLTKLKFLNVCGCQQLRLGEGGPERVKVSHVPRINVRD